MRVFLFCLSMILISQAAHAACTNPAGVEGTMEYFGAPDKIFKYCDGENWVAMGGGSAAVTGWPDAILCTRISDSMHTIFWKGYSGKGAETYNNLDFPAAYYSYGSNTGALADCDRCEDYNCESMNLPQLIQTGRAYYMLKPTP